MYLSLAFIRFLESVPSALAVGLLLLPRLIDEDGGRFKPWVAAAAVFRALLGFALLYLTARAIIPAERPIDAAVLQEFAFGTSVGKAWVGTQLLAFVFAGMTIARLFRASALLDRATLWTGVGVLAVVSVTGHAIDDGLPLWTQLSFLLHTAAGLTWLGGLFGLIWWMFTAHHKPPHLAAKLAERWSRIAKVAIALVAVTGVAMAYENVGSVPNMLATPYGRLLTLKLTLLVAVLLCALAIVRYMRAPPIDEFDVAWVGRIGSLEAVFGVGLLAIAGYIAVITPASHETDLYWPLPFRLSYIATWGQKPVFPSAIWWWAIGSGVFAIAAALIWWTPATREKRLYATPAATIAALFCLAVSFSTEAYIDTYNDPTQDFTAESVARAMSTFQENCVGCHGPIGEGNGPMAKDLKNKDGLPIQPADLTAPHVGTHTIGDIFHWLTFGGQSGVMPSFAHVLDVDDRWDMINYLLMLSSTNQSRFIGPQAMVQWLIAPDFALIDPQEEVTSLFKLRGKPTLLSFARCTAGADGEKELEASLLTAAGAAKSAGVNHVTVYSDDCPAAAKGREALHPAAAEKAYSIINRYPNVPYTNEISQAHFLIDRSGYVRARFKQFGEGDGNTTQFAAQAAMMANEPLIEINLHSH
ncbi:CopD family protein [Methylocystis sp. Sn-Cys]|uniref:CopD family protein n=1 Tax=Methylocystis sp. Sn-Cys TaxID=1701263 RepID=UPI0019210B89|nr:CopD family protein [Methylocystis sp. Sn-Cys]MBL1256121.1 CopD family protein [Methylocystis sp. Sn-Cys]